MTFGQNRSDPGSYRAFARLQGSFALDHSAVPDCNASDIGDGIVGTGVAGKIETQRSCSNFFPSYGFPGTVQTFSLAYAALDLNIL